ncbi:hypothetical protein ACQ4PT_071440 [Festuca glaucescens]
MLGCSRGQGGRSGSPLQSAIDCALGGSAGAESYKGAASTAMAGKRGDDWRKACPAMAGRYIKTSSREENYRIEYATCMKGPRDEMQDYHTAVLELDGSGSTSFFGVFDGHGGSLSLKSDRVHSYPNVIDQTLKRSDEWKKPDSPPAPGNRSFLSRLQTGLCSCFGKNYEGPQDEGSTTCMALIRGNQIIVGNVGDFRCVLSRNGQKAIDLSTDHKPNDPGERARIEAAGGTEELIVYDVLGRMAGIGVGPHRVDGIIAVSRALGDFQFKKNNRLKLTCNPDIRTNYEGPQDEGSTTCMALIRGNQIIVGNVGDFRCVLSRNGQAIDLSTDHKPNDPGERARIEAAGGTEELIVYDVLGRMAGIGVGPHRVDGIIAVSRALGDFQFKKNNRLKLTCNPDIRTEKITDDIDFLPISSDGIWKTCPAMAGQYTKTSRDPAPTKAATGCSSFRTSTKVNGSLYGMRPSIGSISWSQNSKKHSSRGYRTKATFKDEFQGLHEIFDRLRNTVTFSLDGSDEEVLKSFLAALTHMRLWFCQNGFELNFEPILGYQAKTYATPPEGTFYLVITYLKRSITLVIDGRTGWMNGYIGPKGIFQFKKSSSTTQGTPDYIKHCIAKILSFDGSYEHIAPEMDIFLIEVGIKAFRGSHIKMADYDGGEEDNKFKESFGPIVFGLLEAFKSHMASSMVSVAMRDGINTTVKQSRPSAKDHVKGWGKGSYDATNALFRYLKFGTKFGTELLLRKPYGHEVVTLHDYVKYTLIIPNVAAMNHTYEVAPGQITVTWSPVDEGDGDPSVKLLDEYDTSRLSANALVEYNNQNNHCFGRRAGGPPHSSVNRLVNALLLPDCHLPWWGKLPVKMRHPGLPTEQQLRGANIYGCNGRVRKFQSRRNFHSAAWPLMNIARQTLRVMRK